MKISRLVLMVLLLQMTYSQAFSQSSISDIKLGAYYFDGWTGNNKYQLSPFLTDNFPERKPIWGWVTSTQEIMDKQIIAAQTNGISFFSFCWFNNSDKALGVDDKNNALKLFMQSKNKSKLNFNILVANHKGYFIKKTQWNALVNYWCELFKDPSYVKIDGKPLISFISISSMVDEFGGAAGVNEALRLLKKRAKQKGFNDIIVSGCVNTSWSDINQAEKCGFDALTSYNFHRTGFSKSLNEVKSINSMQVAEKKAWTYISKGRTLPIIPTVTLNWDKRPIDMNTKYISSRYTGYSGESVYNSVRNCRSWINQNSQNVVGSKSKYAILYAWNEYSEGAWLTPSVKLNNELLQGVKSAMD